MEIQAVQFLCQKLRMFAQCFDFFSFFKLCSRFATVHFLFRYSTACMSDFICDLTRTYQSIQDGNEKPFKATGAFNIVPNKHFPFLSTIVTVTFALYAEIAKGQVKKIRKLLT